MITDTFWLIVAGAAAGGFVNGLAGFGTALFALGFFLGVLPPVQAVALVLLIAITNTLQGLWVVRHAVFDKPARLMRFLLPALIGVPLGVHSLRFVDAATLKLVIAVFLILYGGFFAARRNLPRFERPTPLADMMIGFTGGVLGGLASLSGALPTMWCSMRPWPKAETRGVLQPYNLCVMLIGTTLLALRGAFAPQVLHAAMVALPVSILCAQAGIFVFRRLSDTAFRRLLILLCLVSGLMLLLRELV